MKCGVLLSCLHLLLEQRQRPFPARRDARTGALGHEVVGLRTGRRAGAASTRCEMAARILLREAKRAIPASAMRRYDAVPDLDERLHGADLVVVHEWNSPDLIAAIGRRRAARRSSSCCSTTLIIAPLRAPAGTCRSSTSTDSTACSRSARSFARSIEAAAGRDGHLPGTRPPISRCTTRCRMSRRNAMSSGSAIGATANAARAATNFCRAPGRAELRAAGLWRPLSGRSARHIRGRPAFGMAAGCPITGCRIAFAGARATVHVPRRPYVRACPGIPTIRVFEAMACGIPLVSLALVR